MSKITENLRQLERKDVRKGDLLLVEWEIYGVPYFCEGTAHDADADGHWRNSDGQAITHFSRKNEKIYLLDRYVKPLPTQEGTFVFVYAYESPSGKRYHSEEPILCTIDSDGDIVSIETDQFHDNGFRDYINPNQVVDWKLAKIIPVEEDESV